MQATDRFCQECGALVRTCTSCSRPLTAGDATCPSCGSTVDAANITEGSSDDDSSRRGPWASVTERLRKATAGQFEIIRELGRGGMAAVFLAHEVRLKRMVAIKVMSPTLATDEELVRRFRFEAQTNARLEHPNIAKVYQDYEAEGLDFFVMGLVYGRSLDTIIRRNGALPIPVVRAVLSQAGRGLAFAHKNGVTHRDVKPANILVSATDGMVIVTDFGIAKVAESPTHTQTGAIIGTPAYMAPEQIIGREITAAVDQYSLGVVAYEMLTGVAPFLGNRFVVMQAHTADVPHPIRERVPDCPPELEAAVLRMLSKDPAQRFASMSDALDALGAVYVAENDPVREELMRLATPSESEKRRLEANTPVTPVSTKRDGDSTVLAPAGLVPPSPLAPESVGATGRRSRVVLLAATVPVAVGAIVISAKIYGARTQSSQQAGAPAAATSPQPAVDSSAVGTNPPAIQRGGSATDTAKRVIVNPTQQHTAAAPNRAAGTSTPAQPNASSQKGAPDVTRQQTSNAPANTPTNASDASAAAKAADSAKLNRPAAVPPSPAPTTTAAPKPTAEEVRAGGVTALRDAEAAIAAALRNRNVVTLSSLLVDDKTARDMLGTVKDGYNFSVVSVDPDQPQVTDQAGSIDFRVAMRWVTAAGPTRNRTATFHSEATRTGTTWQVKPARVSGW